MVSFSIELNKSHQIRSLSLPSKMNPINQKIEQELIKLGTKEEASTSASESIIIGVLGLAELYKCINQALILPMTQQALSLHQHDKHVGELLKEFSNLLTICNSIKEIVLQQGTITENLNSFFSQKKGSLNISSKVATYTCLRKEIIRKAKDIISSLNQLVNNNAEVLGEEDCHLSTVIKSLRCVSIINLSVFESLLSFLTRPVSKPKKSLVSMIMNKTRSKCESGYEINDVDLVLHDLVSGKETTDEKLCFSLKKSKALVDVMQCMENGLEKMCKQLCETKVCLTNIASF